MSEEAAVELGSIDGGAGDATARQTGAASPAEGGAYTQVPTAF